MARTAAQDRRGLTEDFAAWWQRYPRKVGKLAAEKAYAKARQTVSADVLLEGVQRYCACKPAWQDYCHPRTWLCQGRWTDEYTVDWPRVDLGAQTPEQLHDAWMDWRSGCRHEPPCHSWQWHAVQLARARGDV